MILIIIRYIKTMFDSDFELLDLCLSVSVGWHEEMDRKFQSQNSLGEQAKQGSKTALNRRVRHS